MNGYEVLKEFRKWTSVPIIILTVNDDEATKVRLLDAGADDYLTKPFGAPELLARIRVGLRHNEFKEATPVFRSGDLEVDLNQKRVSVDGRPVRLTNTEFEVLSRLVRENGKVVSQSVLLKQIWGHHAEDQSHYLRIYIKHLRTKIEKDPSKPKHIVTESGVGYRII
jgi:two-component system KDP operon response regulator KdpE